MAFPSNQGSRPTTLAQALISISAVAGSIKQTAVALRSGSTAGPISANVIINYVGNLASQRDELATLAAVPGLADYAKAQYANTGLDIAAEYTSLISQVDLARTWIVNNFPKAASGELLEKKFDAQGRTTISTFSSASLASFRTQLDALIAAID